MLTEDELDRVCVVLVRARNPSNIGAVARAMHDFGFSRLRVVNEYPVPFEAAKSAVDASDVMDAAVNCASVAEAVADCTLVVGTTAVGERRLHHDLLPLAEASPRMLAELQRANSPGRVALLFGSEKTGLSNEELSHCNWLLTIPMRNPDGVRHVSMNLGQAAAVCLYELVRESPAASGPQTPTVPPETAGHMTEPVTAAQLEILTSLLNESLDAAEYARRHAHNADPAHIRRLVRRIGADAIDAPVWIGILKQILWKLGTEERDSLEP
jgi:TrmH family RNA methyltransferase